MEWKVRISKAAERDLARAVAWYDAEAPVHVGTLLDDLRAALRQMATHPTVTAPLTNGFRREHLRAYPYRLFYRADVSAREVQVMAMVHDRQDPGPFLERH